MTSVLGTTISLSAFLTCLACAVVLGVLNALVFSYKTKHSASFSMAVALLPTIVTVVIMLVNGNIGTGVAVAGAFALVRFRSMPGTAKEIAAIFSSMALGLVLGMGYIVVAVIFLVVIALFVFVLTNVKFGESRQAERVLKVTIPENLNYDGLFDDLFAEYTASSELDKVRTTNMGTMFELTYNVTFKGASIPKEFIDAIRTRNGNLNISVSRVADKDMM